MTATLSGRAMAFLLRTVLLAGMLAVIAGILGMHIITGSHSMHNSPAAPAADMMQVMQPPATGHTAHAAGAVSAADSPPAPGTTSMPGPSCAHPGGCAAMSAMDASCIPSSGNTSLAAPLPGSTPFAAHNDADAPTPAATYSYLPESPSPGQLCISRT
ncbi:hypothetical protein ACQCSU_21470 [Pseudarthrobacter sp. O4]|uniref:hypothetical protein n=1 Tax=Pseudarthrobacter sp. O4 TaxID=3418417 RepID=UPI003CF423F5